MLSKGIPQGLSFNPHWEGDAPAEPSLLGLASWAQAMEAFEKAVELDPDFGPYQVHPLELTIAEGDRADAEARLARYREATEDERNITEFSLAIPILLGDSAELRQALETGREMVQPKGRVIGVFGSAGLRDVEKRRMMAETSARYADLTVLTAEDPRTDSLEDILAAMADGCRHWGGVEGETFWRIPDRGKAIHFALSSAYKNDIVLICGKGHEQSMCFGEVEYSWDDRTAMEAALCERLEVQGPEMPWLPATYPEG